MDAKSPKAEFLCTTHTACFQMTKLFVLEKKSIKCSFVTSQSCMIAKFPIACVTQSIHTALFLNEKYIKLASITYLIRCFLISTSYLADTIPLYQAPFLINYSREKRWYMCKCGEDAQGRRKSLKHSLRCLTNQPFLGLLGLIGPRVQDDYMVKLEVYHMHK